VGVVTLTPSPAASELPVELRYTETIAEEADEVAYWLKKCMEPADGSATAEARAAADAPTAATLFRSRSTQRAFIDALRRHQVRYHVVGLGGLLEEPEVADVVCALSVLDDPHAGSELIRLLAGPRWRIGAADLRRLRRLAGWLTGTDHAQQRYPE